VIDDPLPSRRQIEAQRVRRLVASQRWRADVWLVRVPRGFVVVKDFRERGFLVRQLLGPMLVAREVRAYRRLRGVEGVPRLVGRLDRHALVLEWIDGRPLSGRDRGRLGGEFFDRMEATLRDIHDRGVVHCDLRQRKNVLVAPGDRPVIVDFAASARFGKGVVSRRLLVPLLSWIDRGGLLKLRHRLAPQGSTARERAHVRTAKLLGRLWLPSAMRRLRSKSAEPERATAAAGAGTFSAADRSTLRESSS
jgi:serine/threonine protein kinase